MAPNGTFQTKNGWLQLLVLKDDDFQNLCSAIDRPDISRDPSFALAANRLENRDALTEILNGVFCEHETEYWRKRLSKAGIQNEAVQSYRDFVENEHVVETGLISWLHQPGSDTPWSVPNVPSLPSLKQGHPDALSPRIGQHTRAVMQELNYSDAEIKALVSNEIIRI